MNSPRTHLLLASVLFIIVVIGYFWWDGAVQARVNQETQLASAVIEKSNVETRAASARVGTNELGGAEDTVNGYFLSQADVVPFLSALQESASALGASANVLSVSADPNSQTLTVAVELTGPFDAVMRSVGALENAPYDLSLTSLTLSNSDKNSWLADLTLVIGTTNVASTENASSSPAIPL